MFRENFFYVKCCYDRIIRVRRGGVGLLCAESDSFVARPAASTLKYLGCASRRNGRPRLFHAAPTKRSLGLLRTKRSARSPIISAPVIYVQRIRQTRQPYFGRHFVRATFSLNYHKLKQTGQKASEILNIFLIISGVASCV